MKMQSWSLFLSSSDCRFTEHISVDINLQLQITEIYPIFPLKMPLEETVEIKKRLSIRCPIKVQHKRTGNKSTGLVTSHFSIFFSVR